MPDPRISPGGQAPGLGVVSGWCAEFRDTDLGPYSEVGISVGLNEPWFRANMPGRFGDMRRGQLHSWLHHLPVTTEIVRAVGGEFYNAPMFIARVELAETPKQRVCRLYEGQEHILTLGGERIATPRSDRIQIFHHLWMDGQPQSFEAKLNATAMGISLRASSPRRSSHGARSNTHTRPGTKRLRSRGRISRHSRSSAWQPRRVPVRKRTSLTCKLEPR